MGDAQSHREVLQRCCCCYVPLLSLLLAVLLVQLRDYSARNLDLSPDPPPPRHDSCVWGTFRPFPYVGLRCQSPSSPLIGLMWYQPSLLLGEKHSWESILRHECAYKDRLAKFGWTQHNGESYGSQLILDPTNNVNLTTDWVLIDAETSHWALRIQGERHNTSTAEPPDLSIMIYLATPKNYTATVTSQNNIVGQHATGDGIFLSYRLWLSQDAPNRHPTYHNTQTNTSVTYNASSYFYMTHVDPAFYYNPKPNVMAELQDPTSSLPPHLFDPQSLYRAATTRTGNQGVLQVFYEVPFTLDVHFTYEVERDGGEDLSVDEQDRRSLEQDRTSEAPTVTAALLRASEQWHRRFLATFAPSHAQAWSPEELTTAQYALGNMLGSLTYMDGDRQLLVDEEVVVPSDSSTLLAIVPDRPNHAQGFFWDEGFHQHLVSLWDRNLTFSIVQSWFAQMDEDTGWIARQQMLGNENRWGARPSSWPQVPGTANPPSLHLLIETLLDRHESATGETCPALNSSFGLFLRSIADPLFLNMQWYLRTQTSDVGPNIFRWSGRTETYCLPSGMDDYPRAPSLTLTEAHLDLQVWMITSVRTAARVCQCLGRTRAATEFRHRKELYQEALMKHFWNKKLGLFDEFWYDDRGEKQWNGHFGYLNFWPLFLHAVDTESAQFELLTQKLLDENNGIWTDYGLRSLSSHDTYYQKGDNYWTGPIWMNINFLIVASLYRYSSQPQTYPMQEGLRSEIQVAYQKLRKNLIRTVVTNYEETGYIWEVYSGDDGSGFNNHPFTGWSALIVNILSEMY